MLAAVALEDALTLPEALQKADTRCNEHITCVRPSAFVFVL